MVTTKNPQATIKRLRRKNKELVQLLAEKENQVINEALLADELVVKLYQQLVELNHERQDPKVQELLDMVPLEIIETVRKQFFDEGLRTAYLLCQSKAEQARDLGSELTAITAESLAEALLKLNVQNFYPLQNPAT